MPDNTLRNELREIQREAIARVCSMFGGSLADLEPEDQEVEFKSVDAILSVIKNRLPNELDHNVQVKTIDNYSYNKALKNVRKALDIESES